MKTLPILLIILSSWTTFSQDLIVTREKIEILGKIIEVGDTHIKYKKQENLRGPIYTIKRTSLIYIEYENGTKDYFFDEKNNNQSKVHDGTNKNEELSLNYGYYKGSQRISKKEFKKLLFTNETSKRLWRGAGIIQVMSFIPAAIGGWFIQESVATGVLLIGSGVGISFLGVVQRKQAIEFYNNPLKEFTD